MSTVNKKKQQRPAEPEPEKTPKPADVQPKPPRRKRRSLYVAGIVLVVLALLVALLPTLLARTPLLRYIVRRAAALNGSLSFQSASLGWFSPTSLAGVTVCDLQGETVLEADCVTCDRTLRGLLSNSTKLGKLRIEKPRLNAKILREGSNVEAVLARWLNGPGGSAASGVDLVLEVVDGEATICDQRQTQQTWRVTNLQLAMDLARQSPVPTRLEATASMPFGGAELYGLRFGPGQLKLRLADGILHAEPLEVSCNGGIARVQPELQAAKGQSPEFRLSAGTLASHVQLDPVACRSALKFVVPVVASATQAKGQFSIQLDGCRIPLGDMSRAEIGGRLIVHSATINPGPIVQQMTSFLPSPPSLVRIPPETVVLFRMTGGRVYHQGLVLEFPELTVRTYGSVGLDESLKLMVETSVPLGWLPKTAVTDAISKEKTQLPIGGTLQSPKLDTDELARVKNQVLANLTRSALQSGLGQQLERLIPHGR